MPQKGGSAASAHVLQAVESRAFNLLDKYFTDAIDPPIVPSALTGGARGGNAGIKRRFQTFFQNQMGGDCSAAPVAPTSDAYVPDVSGPMGNGFKPPFSLPAGNRVMLEVALPDIQVQPYNRYSYP
jgi:hypothetical protein